MKPLTAECIQDLFVPEFSLRGSNARTTEEASHNWYTFVEEVSGILLCPELRYSESSWVWLILYGNE